MNATAEPCQILVLSEDTLTYGRAMYVCQRVLSQFSEQMDFNFHCWNYRQQADADSVHKTVQIASIADVIILSLNTAELPPVLHEWLQAFAEIRVGAEGAMALVLGPEAGSLTAIQRLADHVQSFSDRAGMDFVPLMPENRTGMFPAPRQFWTGYDERPQATDRPHYDHWGLNE